MNTQLNYTDQSYLNFSIDKQATLMAPSKGSRKEITRSKILDGAYSAFFELGYEGATLAEISRRAGVHLQTLIRHFSTKSEILSAIHIATLEKYRELYNTYEGSALACWRDFIKSNAELAPDIPAFPSDSYRFPVLTPEGQAAVHQLTQLLAEGIAKDMGVHSTLDLRPTLIACTLMSGNQHIALSWRGKKFNKDEFVASLLEVIDVANGMFDDILHRREKS